MTEYPQLPNPSEWRRSFAAFVGPDRFRTFVRQFRLAGRLRFWQEEVLGRFFAAHPDLWLGPSELAVALNVCELHGAELLPDTVQVIDGNIDPTDTYNRSRRALFPNAASGPWYTEGGPSPGPTIGVWYCPACRDAETGWSVSPNKAGLTTNRVSAALKRRTTYREHTARFLADERGEIPTRFQARLAEREAEVSAKLRPGDELWEYEFGEWNAFAGSAGLAIMRDGVVVEHWVEWKS